MSATRIRGARGRFESTVRRYNVWEDDTLLFHLWVRGLPKPWCSPSMARWGGEIPKPNRLAMKAWQQQIIDEVNRQAPMPRKYKLPLDGPLSCRVVFYLPRPKARRREVWAQTYADLDNMTKAALDALQRAGVVVNDSRVVELHAAKVWCPVTGPGTLDTGIRLELRRPPAELSKTYCLNTVVPMVPEELAA